MEITLTRRIVPYHERPVERRLNLVKLVAETEYLPAGFEMIPQLLVLLGDTDLNSEQLAEFIRVDVGLTADVLHLANTISYGGVHRSDSLSDAIIRIGLREIFRTVTKVVTSPVLSADDGLTMRTVNLWRHSLATAVGAQVLARHFGHEDPEVVFTAGLLHDIGKVMLIKEADDYFHLVSVCEEQGKIVHEEERRTYVMDHAELGGRLLKKWRFPDRIVAAVAGHHTVGKVAEPIAPLAALLALGNVIAYRIGQGEGMPSYVLKPDPAALRVLNIEASNLRYYEADAAELFRQEQERLIEEPKADATASR